VPRSRWDVHDHYQPGDIVAGKTNSQWVGALDEYDVFDPLFFNISPTEAEFMDPQQRLLLQACWHSIESAGYDARLLSGTKTGVFVLRDQRLSPVVARASVDRSWVRRHRDVDSLRAHLLRLNLQDRAYRSIPRAFPPSLPLPRPVTAELRDSDLALPAASCHGRPDTHQTAQAGMLSLQGKCYAFDQRADGFVPGEGVGVIVLKRLSDARRDRDIIYGVVDGWGVNQDGKTNGITAPNPESQTRLELDVYEKYRIDPSNIQLVEAHGTATKLGDPIEIEGLKASFGKYTQKTGTAPSARSSSIGHTLTAAGIAATIKLLLALQHKQLPPTIHFETLNEHIDLTGSPFYVNTGLQDWPLGGASRRQAAVSSFGFSGTNAHFVIGEYQPPLDMQQPVARLR
jgi:acyl transferase domain-containing protein